MFNENMVVPVTDEWKRSAWIDADGYRRAHARSLRQRHGIVSIPIEPQATAFAMVAATGDTYFGLWYPVAIALITVVIGFFMVPETYKRDIFKS